MSDTISVEELQNQVTTLELKGQALLQRVAELTSEYENKVSDLRVAYTLVSQERDQLRAEAAQNQSATDSE